MTTSNDSAERVRRRAPSVLDGIVQRDPLVNDGKSGSVLDLAVLEDGEVAIIKHVVPGGDWIMRATGDDGRARHLWSAGLLERVPTDIEHAVRAVEEEGDGWVIVMRDVSAGLLPDDQVITRAESRRILHAVHQLHEAFSGQVLEGLCTLTDRYGFLSPTTARREASGTDVVPKVLARGWELFAEIAPADVAEGIFAILDRPELLARELDGRASTLVHGDLKLANIGFLDDRIVLLDWGSLTGAAPPAVDFAWYLAINATRIEATCNEIVEDFRSIYGGSCDDTALDLSLLGGLAQLGWEKALGAVDHHDGSVRQRELRNLEWWYAAARRALRIWSPT